MRAARRSSMTPFGGSAAPRAGLRAGRIGTRLDVAVVIGPSDEFVAPVAGATFIFAKAAGPSPASRPPLQAPMGLFHKASARGRRKWLIGNMAAPTAWASEDSSALSTGQITGIED